MRKYLYIVFVFCVVNLSAQNTGNIGNLPIIALPQTPNPYQYNLNRQPANPHNPNEWNDIQRRNQTIINETTVDMQRQSTIQSLTEKGFPSQEYKDPEGAKYFYRAFAEMDSMLQGKIPLNLARAVFLVENAFYGNTLDYEKYQGFIKQEVQFCNRKIKEEKLNGNDNLVKNMMLFRLVADTLYFKNTGNEQTQVHLPIKYDYKDYQSQKYYDSHFVTKLMKSGTGQCYSMPLYYLILAEAMNAEAYWSFSPKHSFVKIQDEKGVWYNLELTCGAILSDAHYMNNSYIKAEAIRNKLYLEPMDKTNIIAEMLINLASYYRTKYGLDDFYLQCTNTAEKYLDNDLDVIMLKAEYQTRLTLALAELLQAPNPEILEQKSPDAYKHYEKMQELYKQIDALGYEELPNEIYAKWLDYVAKQKNKQSLLK